MTPKLILNQLTKSTAYGKKVTTQSKVEMLVFSALEVAVKRDTKNVLNGQNASGIANSMKQVSSRCYSAGCLVWIMMHATDPS